MILLVPLSTLYFCLKMLWRREKCDLVLCAAMVLPSSIIVADRQLDVNCAMLCYKPDNQLVIITDYY